jgi:hypothetical protein
MERSRSRGLLLIVALVGLVGCAMARHRAQVRQGLLTRGLHRGAFLKEWGPPTRTFSLPAREPVLRTHPFGASWERPVYEVWEYQDRATCLVFDGVRLVSWETGRTDCTPKPPRERTERKRSSRPPPPYPPYP